MGVNIYGTTQLKQQFEQKWFLPTGTVVRDYMDLNDEVATFLNIFPTKYVIIISIASNNTGTCRN